MKAQHQVISGFLGICCTFYLCAGVTCRLVPVIWVGVQLYPAAYWKQKQRLSLADSHTEQLRFSLLLTFLRDSHWGGFTFLLLPLFLLSVLFAAVLCRLDRHTEGFQIHPLPSVTAHLFSVARPCQRFFCRLHQQLWCHSFLMYDNHIKPDLSLLLLIKFPQMWRNMLILM